MKNVYKPRIIALACCAVLLISALIGGGLAKYTQRVGETGQAASLKLQLATAFAAEEKGIETLVDGSNETAADTTNGNEYWLIPGTKLNKAPTLTITQKTEIPSYLYAVIENTVVANTEKDDHNNAEGVVPEVTASWKLVKEDVADGVKTSVYVYTGGGTNALLIDNENAPANPIPVLEDNAVYNKYLEKATEDQEINIWGILVQVTDDTLTEEAAYEQLGTKVLKDSTVKLENTLKVVDVSCTINETFDGTEKKNVTVENTGDVPALIRAKVVVNWVDGEGNIVANPPTDHTYSITYGSDWLDLDNNGYYYYNGIVAKAGSTTALVTSAKQTGGDKYRLQIEIIAEAIQATGFVNPVDGTTPAAQNAWGHYYDGSWN